MTRKLLVVCLTTLPIVANAEFLSGNELLSRMQDQSHGLNMMALGYVGGVFDAGQSVTHCAPATVTLGQVRDMAKNHMIINPESRNSSADSIILNILRRTWPCRNGGQPI